MNAPAHTPRHPLQDNLYWVLADYRAYKRTGVSPRKLADYRRRALEIIAQIKGRS